MMGMPFHGMSLMGYDNQKKKYFSALVDSMSTGLMVFEGTCDEAGKVFTFTGEYDDAMTSRHLKVRTVSKFVSPDHTLFEWFETGPEGKEGRHDVRHLHPHQGLSTGGIYTMATGTSPTPGPAVAACGHFVPPGLSSPPLDDSSSTCCSSLLIRSEELGELAKIV